MNNADKKIFNVEKYSQYYVFSMERDARTLLSNYPAGKGQNFLQIDMFGLVGY